MSDLATTSKVCTRCGAEKPLSEFYRQLQGRGGRRADCKDCSLASVKASQARQREEIGEEAWRELVRQRVAKHRASGRSKDKIRAQAWWVAERRLREMYPDAWDALYREERYKRGLPI